MLDSRILIFYITWESIKFWGSFKTILICDCKSFFPFALSNYNGFILYVEIIYPSIIYFCVRSEVDIYFPPDGYSVVLTQHYWTTHLLPTDLDRHLYHILNSCSYFSPFQDSLLCSIVLSLQVSYLTALVSVPLYFPLWFLIILISRNILDYSCSFIFPY